jgi:transcriptional regulator with XRE-family HTH domain
MKNRIREIRKKRELTLEELASKLETGARTIQRFEVGERDPDTSWLERISKVLKIKPSELLMEDLPDSPLTSDNIFFKESSAEDYRQIMLEVIDEQNKGKFFDLTGDQITRIIDSVVRTSLRELPEFRRKTIQTLLNHEAAK